MPGSVEDFRSYFASVRGELCTSPDAQAAIAFVRRPTLPALPPAQRVLMQPAFRAMGDAATALVPGSLRELAGLPGRGPRDLPSRLAVGAAANALAAASAVPVLRTAVEQPISRTLGTRRPPRPAAAA